MKRKKLILIGVAAAVACALGITACASVANNVRKNPVRAISNPDASVTFSNNGYSNQQDLDGVSIDIDTYSTITFDKASASTAPKYFNTGSAIRAYGGGTFTIVSSKTIVAIDLAFGSGDGSNTITSNVGTYAAPSWNGSSNTVVFTVGGTTGNRRVAGVSIKYYSDTSTCAVSYNANGGEGTMEDDDSPYAKNSTVTVLDNEFTRESYSFVKWNTAMDGSGVDYNGGDTFVISNDVTLYAQWIETFDEGSVTYNLSDMFDSTWSTSYTDHEHEFVVSSNETAVVSIKSSNKQAEGQAITDVPVSKGGDVTFVLNSETRYIKNITFHAKQWGTKQQTMTLHTSNDGGLSYTNTTITSSNFRIRGTNFSSGTNAVKVTFSYSGSDGNQVGYVDFVVTYENLPTTQATSMVISPASLSLYGEEQGTFTPTLVGGQGNYEKTITWTSSHPSIIAAPANSEAGVAINVTPARVQSDTNVTLTGIVDVANGASASIIITVKVIKEVSVESVSVSGISNNAEFDGSNDRAVCINATKQLSATVNYAQGDAYMDGTNEVSWSSSSNSIATVDQNGLVTFKGNGEVVITATSDENNNIKGTVSFAISNINDEPGSENNPYTVAEAKAAIDSEGTISAAYVQGIISQIDEFNETYNSITYWISDDGTTSNQLEVYSGKWKNGADFSSIDDLVVGAEVVVTGNLKLYKTTYEFDKNNQVVTYNVPAFGPDHYLNTVKSMPTIHGEAHTNGSLGSVVFADLGLENGVQYTDPFDGDNFEIVFAGGGNDGKYYTTGSGIRTYGGGSFTISKKGETNITKIVLSFDGSDVPTASSADVGTYTPSNCTWTGSASSVTFTRASGSGHWRLKSVEVSCGEVSTIVENVKLRFGIQIPKTSWDNVLAECGEITEYGIMLFKRLEGTAYPDLTVKQAFDTGKNYNTASVTNGQLPNVDDDNNYIFSAQVKVKEANYGVVFCAQAYVVVGSQHYFLGEMMEYSVRSLASLYVGNTSYEYLSQAALTVLAGNQGE